MSNGRTESVFVIVKVNTFGRLDKINMILALPKNNVLHFLEKSLQDALQRTKTHPLVRLYLKGGKTAYRAFKGQGCQDSPIKAIKPEVL